MAAPRSSLFGRLAEFYQKEIWRPEYLGDRSAKGIGYAILRVVSITLTGIIETKAPSRAAALSFSSLLGMGPLVALVVLVSGFVLDQKDPDIAVKSLNSLILKVAPQVADFAADSPEEGASPAEQIADANPALVELINGFITGSRSGAVGAIGIFSLILIVIQLFTTIENAFNEIWGVRQGRSWITRIYVYWTLLTLGALIFFTAVTGLSAGAFLNTFAQNLAEHFPLGNHLVGLLQLVVPALSIVLLILVLTLFYRFIPNTKVLWKAALAGAALVALLLVVNNLLAFLYLKRVILTKSLYGSLGLPLILMFGLYIFWLFVLIGGQVSYAVQNVQFRNSQAAWQTLPDATRERLTLGVMIAICRRFQACEHPCRASDLGARLGVPNHILNECVSRLVRMGLLNEITPEEDDDTNEVRYQPSRPLNRLNLAEFKQRDDNYGEEACSSALTYIDPILQSYDRAMEQAMSAEFFQKNLESLIDEHPVS